jgi:hypothetical protein
MIRLAFEEQYDVKWDEEDWAYGHWLENGRKFTYGYERPLDQPDESQSRLAFLFRLATAVLLDGMLKARPSSTQFPS